MTTLQRYPELERVYDRLDVVRSRYFLVQLAQSAAALGAILLGALSVLGLVGYWPGQPPAALRWGMLLAFAAALAGTAGALVVLSLRRRLNYHQTARFVEQRLPDLHNALINAVQLGDDQAQPSPELVAGAIHETAWTTGRRDLSASIQRRPLRQWLMALAASALVLSSFALLQPRRLARGLSAVLSPGSYVTHLGSVTLISLEPGDATVFAGQSVTVVARVENPDRRRLPARVELPEFKAERTMLASMDASSFTAPLGKADQSFQYCVRIGDSKFPSSRPYYQLTVLQRVGVEGLDLTYEFPVYTRRSPLSVPNSPGPIEAPQGANVRLVLRLSAPVPAAYLETRAGAKAALRVDGRTLRGELRVAADDAYRIVLTDLTGRKLQQLPDPAVGAEVADSAEAWYPIHAVPDQPPKIEFIEPNRDMPVPPGGKLPLRLKVSDDYGLAQAGLTLFREGAPEPRVPSHDFAEARDQTGATARELAYTIEVPADQKLGDVLVYYATATDTRELGAGLGPQTTNSARFKVLVHDAAQVAADRAKKYEQLRARLMALLEAQSKLRVSTRVMRKKLADLAGQQVTEAVAAGLRAGGQAIAAGQEPLRADMLDLVEHFPFDPEMATIQRALAMLGNNEAALAVTQARVLAELGEPAGGPDAADALAATQDKIIQALQTLLSILPSLANQQDEKSPSAAADLPPEAKEKLKALSNQLDKFIEEQRKSIQAAERLTKKPVDTLSPDDQKLLKDLELAQDKWEKFLNEAFTDFSKIGAQDFSNPELLKELISVKTDVTMAKDALAKKAAEIATALEDNGIENAKSLTANIEKWLPDEPDRQKWAMEDPAAQANAEQPELPKELEDLVGDLLEEEEDLFEEMDDLTGKYTQSGDKGIGWDAMDGPISNMNAQGVTGNQLPNTNEISGRSGEGRQGKSSGEFVEDKAVGKGGRRTPTRLSPEPFQQGQVNDISQEPAGGATGGGKLSGAGGEGLEGPLAPQLQEDLKRMAGKQAQLRNKAERVQAGLKVTDYSNYQMLQAITLMSKVQNDLENYRYANALRQQHATLNALKQTQLLLSGKVDVMADATLNMPKQVKDDIADAMRAKLPPEYRDALQRYFTRLAEGGNPTTSPSSPPPASRP